MERAGRKSLYDCCGLRMDQPDLACNQNFTSFDEGKEAKEGRKIKEDFLISIDD
jgi:hypothetical protein